MKKFAPVACVSVAALLAADYAVAQNLDVVTRSRPAYDDPIGIPAGSFTVFPHAKMGVKYDSNIYAQATNEQDDFIAVLPLGVDVDSDWNNHALNLFAEGEFGFYSNNSAEDYIDYAVGFDGRIDVRRSFHLFGGGAFRHLHEDRGSPDSTISTEPTEFDRTEANIGVTWKPNRLGVTIEGLYHGFDFDDATGSTGAVINNDDRDRERVTGRLRVSYDLQPGYAAFVQGRYNEIAYANTPDDRGFLRDSDGVDFRGGVAFDITGVVSGDVFIGYMERDYADSDLNDVGVVDVGGNILWGVTPLTTVRINLSRSIEETALAESPGHVATGGGIGIDHELRRNLLVGGTVDYVNNNYEGIARDDDILSLSLRTTYMIDRTFRVGADAGWRDRDSNVVNSSYDRFQVGAWVGVRF